jgi:cell wall-associated NlpC family hydrolase/LysM repeat protein
VRLAKTLLGVCVLLVGAGMATAQAVEPSSSSETNPELKAKIHLARNGDRDWTIARRFDVCIPTLRIANPTVNWKSVRVGEPIVIPPKTTDCRVIEETSIAALRQYMAELRGSQSNVEVPRIRVVGNLSDNSSLPKGHKVREGDTDWTIAKRYGLSTRVLRELNPSVNWSQLETGIILRLPEQVSPENSLEIRTPYAEIADNSVNVREEPGSNARRLTVVQSGIKARVLASSDGWYKLRFPRGTEGWVRADMLKPTTPPVQVEANRDRVAANTAAPQRTAVQSSIRNATIRSQQNRRNIASNTNTRRNTGNAVPHNAAGANSVVRYALSYQGTRYRWGGTSRNGVDCSGLVTAVYRQHGVSLPRTSASQYANGQRVSRDNLKQGDLVYFRTRGSRVSHVGIYVGNGNFVHASSGSGRVQVNSLNSGFYAQRYVGATRPTGARSASASNQAAANNQQASRNSRSNAGTREASSNSQPQQSRAQTAPSEESGSSQSQSNAQSNQQSAPAPQAPPVDTVND